MKNNEFVAGVNLIEIKGSTDKLKLTIDSSRREKINDSINEMIEYLSNIPEIKHIIEQQRVKIIKQIEEISLVIRQSEVLVISLEKMLKNERLLPVGFNPIELNRKASDLKVEKLVMEQSLKNLEAIKMVEPPYVFRNPVKPRIKRNIGLAGILGLFMGVFLALIMEYTGTKKKKEF